MTSEHLQPLLERVECSRLFGEVAPQFARGEMLEEILRGIKMGRMTSLQKRDGGVHGIVVGGRGPHNCTTCFVHQSGHGMCGQCGAESDQYGQ